MSRFDNSDGEGMPWEIWEQVVSNALGGRKGQAALAGMEAALLALPEAKLIEGHLAAEGAVCAVGAFVAAQKAAEQKVDLAAIIDAMSAGVACYCGHTREKHTDGACQGTGYQGKPCYCDGTYEPEEIEDSYETVEAGKAAGLPFAVAWHLAYLNDEQFSGLTPEKRYATMLGWVRRAQGKPTTGDVSSPPKSGSGVRSGASGKEPGKQDFGGSKAASESGESA